MFYNKKYKKIAVLIFFIVAFSISTFYGYTDSSYLVEAASEGQNPFDEVSSPSDSIPISEALLSDGEVDSGALPHGISVTYYSDIYSRGFAWSTDDSVSSSSLFIIQKSGDMSISEISWDDATEYEASMVERTDVDGVNWHIFKAHVLNLSPGETYFYRVGNEATGYSEVGTLKVDNVTDSVIFLHVTDSQESSIEGYDKWGELLRTAKDRFPNASFVSFSGDFTNRSFRTLNMNEWVWGLDSAADALMNMPIVPCVGNHDGCNNTFVDRFDINYADYVPDSEADTLSGGSYYITYGDNVLFINLNTNIRVDTPEFDSQVSWVSDVLDSHSDYKWKVVQLHKGPLSTGSHTNEADVKKIREVYCPIFSKNEVDIVLQGHDHVYTRTASYAFRTDNEPEYDYKAYKREGFVTPSVFFEGANRIWNLEPTGTHYITINYSASKKYNPVSPSNRTDNIHIGFNPISGNGCDIQPGLPMFGVVSIRNDVLCYDAYTFDASTKEINLYDTFTVDKSVDQSAFDWSDPIEESDEKGSEDKEDKKDKKDVAPDKNSNTDEKGHAKDDNSPKYFNEWVNGKWYNKEGKCDYAGTLYWKKNSTGWWVEDTEGWYPKSQWQKIDGKWYFFTADGYMDYSEYRDGYWLGADGALIGGYEGKWKKNSTGWWFEDVSGWYPKNQSLWIDGVKYYFENDGYLK